MHSGATDGMGGEEISPGASSHTLTLDAASADRSRTEGWEDWGTGGAGRGRRMREDIDAG
jgi:hypothetical protein